MYLATYKPLLKRQSPPNKKRADKEGGRPQHIDDEFSKEQSESNGMG
jgi:hypothetical protein